MHNIIYNYNMLILQTVLFISAIAVVDVLTATHVLITKTEDSVSATLWLFVIFTFPIFGVVLYLFVGIDRIETLGLKIELANTQLNTEQKSHLDQAVAETFDDLQRYTYNYKTANNEQFQKTIDSLLPGTIPLTGNSIELLHDGTSAYPQMLAAIQKAKHNIHLQSFIINNDIIGKTIFDLLAQKAREGVEVKVLYDRFGSFRAVIYNFFAKYANKTPHFQMRPFALVNLFAPWRIQLRNHRKLLVVDGKTAFIGGINISSDNDLRVCNKDRYIHDLHCMILGPAVTNLQLEFLRDWHYAAKLTPAEIFRPEYFPPITKHGDSVIRAVNSGPGQRYAAAENMFFTAAVTAKSFLWLITPYFVPDRAFLKAIQLAAAKGIDVRIIVPKYNNHWYVKLAARSLYESLLKNGVRVFEKTGIFSHAKAMLIDNEWGYMGSSNCDVRSFRLNYELDFVVSNGGFIQKLYEQFLGELHESEEILLTDVRKKKLPMLLLENLCALLTPIL
jgi:cardiolipin synthase